MKIFCALFLLFNYSYCLKFQEKYSWSTVDFNWPSEEFKEHALRTKNYIPNNNIVLGVERWRNKLFITVPRWRPGVASALNYIDLSNNEKSPKLIPYPSWEANFLPNKSDSSIVSPFRVKADECDRLWVMDGGFDSLLGPVKIVKPNAIAIYDLRSDQLIRRFEIPSENLIRKSLLTNIIVDTSPESCEDAYAYIADMGGHRLHVYSLRENRSWMVQNSYLKNDANLGTFSIAKHTFKWDGGLFGLALGKTYADNSRDVYFHSLINFNENVVNNRVLQDERLSKDLSYYKPLGSRGQDSYSTVEVYDNRTGVLFYTLISINGVGCWNTNKPLVEGNAVIADRDPVSFVFPNDMKLDNEGNLWIVTDRMFHFIRNQLDYKEVNYRVLVGRVEDIIRGTACEGS